MERKSSDRTKLLNSLNVRRFVIVRSTLVLKRNDCITGTRLSLVITSRQVATLSDRLIFAIVSTCGLYFRLRPRSRPAASIFDSSGLNSIQVPEQHYGRSSMRCSTDDASPWWRLYDVTANRCAQLCCGPWLKRCGCKSLEKVKFSQTDDPSAISDIAYSTITYDVGQHAKFHRRT